MNRFFSVTSDKINNQYTVSINIPSSESSSSQVIGEFIVVIKGTPTKYPNDATLPMFERYRVKIIEGANCSFDTSSLGNLAIFKKITNNTPKEISFKNTDISVSGGQACGTLDIKKVGLVSQEPTSDSTKDGQMMISEKGIGTFNILEHKEQVVTDFRGVQAT
jgi:hypothetical protein